MKLKNIKLLSVLVLVGVIFSIIYFRSPLRVQKGYPILSGSFIQIDMTQNWNQEKWNDEFKYLKQNKMEYVILTGISSTDHNITKTAYKSSIPGVKKIYGTKDEVELCLKSAEKFGVKVFLGTDFNSEWWNNSANNFEWINKQMDRTNLICDELYKKYHEKYRNSFYGWYFPYEVDNARFNTTDKFDTLAKAINMNLDYLDSKGERLPFLISPFMNSEAGSSLQYAENWKHFFQRVNFKQGDIFCPQDSVGAGGLDIDQVNEWFTALRHAVDTKKGLKFWANIETFDYVNSSSITLDELVKKMELESPCVDKFVSFSYSHYYSPNNIDSGFNDDYEKYVLSGKLKHRRLARPKNLSVKEIGDYKFKISWNMPTNAKNICAYRVYRNGVLIYNPTIQRKYGGDSRNFCLYMIDKPLPEKGVETYTYEVKAVDFSGNLSKSARPVSVKVEGLKVSKNLLSLGSRYNMSPQPDFDYLNKEIKLTDGKYASGMTVKDEAFAAWYGNSFNIDLDLGKLYKVNQFMIDCYREPRGFGMLPKAASVAVSEDGVNFKPVGLFQIPSVPFSDRNGTKYPFYLTLDRSVNARYVKFTIISEPNYYTVIDEIQVRN